MAQSDDILSLPWPSAKELESWLHIGKLRSRSHFWTSETMPEYLEFFAEDLRERRRALGLSLSDACLLLCDHASQHSSKHFASFKSAWCEQHNVVPCLFELSIYIFICVFCVKNMSPSFLSKIHIALFGIVSGLAPSIKLADVYSNLCRWAMCVTP